ncbi:MAG: phosphohydrolase [Kiritimatiellae bacterium]|nr:phosphohydrolase [Kiritimatiellia bacterium]MDD4736165.1 phosphohydrolase [Kiritimatiellia bacterium]
MTSPKERSMNKDLANRLSGYPLLIFDQLVDDPEIATLQEYANTVSIKRLGFNDHGPVHMRTVTRNAILMLELLQKAGIPTNLEKEEIGTFEDSLCAVVLAAFLHDLGMSISREHHERSGADIALPIMERVLLATFPSDIPRRTLIRALAYEGIIGHMGSQRIHSLEAGVILVADGCDMKKGRARIPMILTQESRVGDIHKYSAAAIEDVRIGPGNNLPIRIEVDMSSSVGFFQVEEVLMQKINMSPIKPYIELCAGVKGGDIKCYMGGAPADA